MHRFRLIPGLVAIGMILLLACQKQSGDTSGEKIEPLTKHWEKAVPLQTPPRGLKTLSAKECGSCHMEIYQEWKASFHAKAWFDPQFQVEWAKDDSLWVCINCHTPLVNQQPHLILGKKGGDYFQPVKKENPDFDPALRDEGITCAVCHVRDGAVLGPYGNQKDAPHAVRKATDGELSEKLCMSCHNVTDVLNPTLVCTFQTGEEWKAGPYSKEGQTCITCHMPIIERPLYPKGPVRVTRKHIWIGSGIPKTMDEKAPVDHYIPGLELRVVTSKKRYQPGETAYISVLLTNRRAGHLLPTGDPEYFFTVELAVVDENGAALQDTTLWIGQKWQWWPVAKKLKDNRIRPLETRNYPFVFSIPEDANHLRFRAIVRTHRMTREIAEQAGLLGIYPLNIVSLKQEVPLVE